MSETPKKHHIRVEMVVKPLENKMLQWIWKVRKRKNVLIQGKPVAIFIKFTNKGNQPTPTINVSDFRITSSSAGLGSASENSIVVPQLNPDETKEVYLVSVQPPHIEPRQLM